MSVADSLEAWRVARSLEQLRAQLDELAPRRSRASDGSIGDAAHATRDSDHNPWFVLAGQPLVTARDFTHDPGGGLDCNHLADALIRGRDPRLKYMIWNAQIMAGAGGPHPWIWRPYRGQNAHRHHLHLSVVADARADSAIPWQLRFDQLGPLVRQEDTVAWTAQEGAPPIADWYREGLKPLPDPATALAWATAHAAHARDEARYAADVAARVEAKLDQVLAMLGQLAPGAAGPTEVTITGTMIPKGAAQ